MGDELEKAILDEEKLIDPQFLEVDFFFQLVAIFLIYVEIRS